MPEKNLLSADYSYLLNEDGEYVVIDEDHTGSLVTRKGSLTTDDRHIMAASTGGTVLASSTGDGILSMGGLQPLYTRRSSPIIPPDYGGGTVSSPNTYGPGRYGFATYSAPVTPAGPNSYGNAQYGDSTYA
jgi:hypothetical protein